MLLDRQAVAVATGDVASPALSSRRRSNVSKNYKILAASQNGLVMPASPAAFSREWSSRSDRADGGSSGVLQSPTSSIAPSPGTRIRTIMHTRAVTKAAPRLSGDAFAHTAAIFDHLSVDVLHTNNIEPCAEEGGAQLSNATVAGNAGNAPGPGSMDNIILEDDVEQLYDFAVQLTTLVSVVQGLASKHLGSESVGVLDKMFLTQVLCEIYKLKHDVYFGELVALTTAANANVLSSVPDSAGWSCDAMLAMLAEAARIEREKLDAAADAAAAAAAVANPSA